MSTITFKRNTHASPPNEKYGNNTDERRVALQDLSYNICVYSTCLSLTTFKFYDIFSLDAVFRVKLELLICLTMEGSVERAVSLGVLWSGIVPDILLLVSESSRLFAMRSPEGYS